MFADSIVWYVRPDNLYREQQPARGNGRNRCEVQPRETCSSARERERELAFGRNGTGGLRLIPFLCAELNFSQALGIHFSVCCFFLRLALLSLSRCVSAE
jgi:hypothetical protein